MTFVSYLSAKAAWGVVRKGAIISGKRLLRDRVPDLRSVLTAGLMTQALGEAETLEPDLALSDVTFLPPIWNPGHIFCAGLNYAAHAAEAGRQTPEAPRMFLRAASSLVGHGLPIMRPKVSDRLDFEGELAVVIGLGGRHISETRAMDHVAGYSCFMDGSLRDWQQHSVTAGKNFHATGAFGPFLVSSLTLRSPAGLTLVTRVNGQEVQRTTTDLMIHTIPRLIAYLSAMTPLLPGDVIVTGTPEGIGSRREPPLWLRPGDSVEVDVSAVGLLSNPVAQEE